MAELRKLRELLESGDFDEVEIEWLERLEEDPHDVEFFSGAARGLAGQAQEARAANLLEMLDNQLQTAGSWRERLSLLQRAGHLFFAPAERLHEEILASLARLYGARPSFEGLVEAVGLRRAPGDIPKTWEKVERFSSLIVFDLGEIVWMEGKGAGRVMEVSQPLQSFRVDFAGFPRLSVGFKAAPKLLRRLPPEHVLYRKIVEPQTLRELAERDPSELLRIVLQSYEQPLTAAEIKRDLVEIVDEGRWASWWSAARKHPQVSAGTAGRQTYGWAASSAQATDRAWEAFRKAEPRKRIDLLRREGARDPELRRKMEDDLLEMAAAVAAKDPGLAIEIWFALDKSGRAPADAPWSPPALLAGAADARATLAGVEDRALRERAYAVLAEVRADWPSVYLAALSREEDPRSLDLLAGALARESTAGASRVDFGRFLDGLLAQPHKAPAAFVWLAERAAGDEALRARSPLRLFQQIFTGLSVPELAPYRARLLALGESGGTIPRLFAHLTEEQAAPAEEAVQRAAGLENYQREDLLRALQMRFASLRKEAHTPLYALRASIDAKQAELQQIVVKEIPANRKAIEEARAMGDLRENFEYKSARQRHEYLTARAGELKEQLNRARPIDLAAVDGSEVRVGTTVELADAAGGKRRISILGPWESDPEAGVISYESELGKGMLGAKVGAEMTIGATPYTIAAVEPYRT